MASHREAPPTPNEKQVGEGREAIALTQSFLGFLDRNLRNFSRRVRDAIGLTILGLLTILVLHTFLGTTFVQGHLFVQSSPDDVKTMAKGYTIVRGSETFLSNENGYWMLPLKGFVPQRHRVQVKDETGKYLAEFVVWGPWPILNALQVSEYDVLVHTYKKAGSGRVEIARANGAGSVLRLPEFLLGFDAAWAQPALERWQLPYVRVYVEGFGDLACSDGGWCGSRAESRRLEGFAIRLVQRMGDVGLTYRCHLEKTGPTPWLQEGEFCGTRGESRLLEGFEIQLRGRDAARFTVAYQAHVEDTGDTAVVRNGGFAGSRGESRRVEAIRVWLERR